MCADEHECGGMGQYDVVCPPPHARVSCTARTHAHTFHHPRDMSVRFALVWAASAWCYGSNEQRSGGTNRTSRQDLPQLGNGEVTACPFCPEPAELGAFGHPTCSDLRVSHPDTDIPGQMGFAPPFALSKTDTLKRSEMPLTCEC